MHILFTSPLRPLRPLVGALLAVATLSTLPALAQPPEHRPSPTGPGDLLFEGPAGHLPRHVDRMLDGLGVTPAQRAQIRQVVAAAATDLRQQRQAGQGLRERGLQLFTAPNLDAAAAESLRQEMETQHDHASRRVLEAMLDIAQVLTPDQRAKIGARMKEREAVMQDRRQRMGQGHHAPPPASLSEKP